MLSIYKNLFVLNVLLGFSYMVMAVVNQPQELFENVNVRYGKILTNRPSPFLPLLSPPKPPPTPESSGYFSRIFGWLNPFSSGSNSSTPEPQSSDDQNNYFKPLPYQSDKYGPSKTSLEYEPYINQILPRPPLPPSGQSYSQPLVENNEEAWIPISGLNRELITSTDSPSSSSSSSNEVKFTDFTDGPSQYEKNYPYQPENNNQIKPESRQPDYYVPITAVIPYPHLFPGALPPLFHESPFYNHIAPQASERMKEIVSYNSTSEQTDNSTLNLINFSIDDSNNENTNHSNELLNDKNPVIHVVESPIIDLSLTKNITNNSSIFPPSNYSKNIDLPVTLQNLDGSNEINKTNLENSTSFGTFISLTTQSTITDQRSKLNSTIYQDIIDQNSLNKLENTTLKKSLPTTVETNSFKTFISSTTQSTTTVQQTKLNSTIYQDRINQNSSNTFNHKNTEGPTSEKPLRDAIYESYQNFLKLQNH